MAGRSSLATSSETQRVLPKRASTRGLTGRIVTLAAGAALLLGAGLSWEMSRGADPALRSKAVAAGLQIKPPRRIVKTVVVRRVSASRSPSPGSSAAATTATSTPAATAAAPVTSGTS
jgi:hypothetical protein